eukprot:CAMPEP_0172751796 /NCGR_PEP_ID=MMETSP1074-20121228/152537_1 /TAXON_ID=2916 /ORGANISM="Ceratium fusus, Strain PA161109" /LENGTH=133 /DNA_ID=CAMNT_0013584205 /DNA_START=70 /DNA_END=468 /DNA_ORIENTATION=-
MPSTRGNSDAKSSSSICLRQCIITLMTAIRTTPPERRSSLPPSPLESLVLKVATCFDFPFSVTILFNIGSTVTLSDFAILLPGSIVLSSCPSAASPSVPSGMLSVFSAADPPLPLGSHNFPRLPLPLPLLLPL